MADEMTNQTAWSIYANGLELLALVFWWSVLPPVLGITFGWGLAYAAEADAAGAIVMALGLLVGAFAFPIVVGARATRIRTWLNKQ